MKYSHSFILVVLVILITSCSSKVEEIQEEVLRPVRYGKVIQSESDDDQLFSGTIQASKESKLSFKVAGTISRLGVKVGDRVRNGQFIAQIDALDYTVNYDQAVAQLKSAETQIKSAETQLTTSRANYSRMEKLYENNSIPLSEYENAKGTYETAQSQYEAALAQVAASKKQSESAKNQVDYTTLRAPFTGVITELMIEENEIVNSGSAIAVLSSEVEPEVRVGIPEIFISRIENGQKVEIQLSVFPGQLYHGMVSEVGYSVGSGATYPVIVQLEEHESDIRPGMAATVKFHFHKNEHATKYTIAPVKAVGENPEGNFVFVLEPSDDGYLVKRKQVEIGGLLSSGFEVLGGLEEGEIVATAGLNSLLDGMKVRLSD